MELSSSSAATVVKLPFTHPELHPSVSGASFVSVRAEPVPGGAGAWALHVVPTYVLRNQLDSVVQVRQQGTAPVLSVAPGQDVDLVWPDASLPLKLQVRHIQCRGPHVTCLYMLRVPRAECACVKCMGRIMQHPCLMKIILLDSTACAVMTAMQAHHRNS